MISSVGSLVGLRVVHVLCFKVFDSLNLIVHDAGFPKQHCLGQIH